MTPRESLEAAGWTCRRGTWWLSPNEDDTRWYREAEALAQLARDEAKETSDGSVKEKVQLETVSVPHVSSPVAGNVATQGYAQNSVQAAPVVSEMLGKYLNTMVADLHIEGNGQYLRDLFSKFEREYASSSSAALLAANEVIRRQLKKVCDQAEAAEEKCAELEEQCEVYATNCAMNLVELNRLVDSRDRLQEALRGSETVVDNLAAIARRWVEAFDVYWRAWLREIGGVIVPKHHEIDGFVLRTRAVYDKAKLVDRIKKILCGELKAKSDGEKMFDAVFKFLAEDGNDKTPTN